MDLVYEHDGSWVGTGDATEVLPNMLDNTVDAIVTDPPHFPEFREWLAEFRRVLRPGGALYVWGNRAMDTSALLWWAGGTIPWQVHYWTDGEPQWRHEEVVLGRPVKNPRHLHHRPESVISQLLERHGGDVVLDPFCGGGSTLVAAASIGSRAWGVELDADHAKTSAEALRATLEG